MQFPLNSLPWLLPRNRIIRQAQEQGFGTQKQRPAARKIPCSWSSIRAANCLAAFYDTTNAAVSRGGMSLR